jgi:DNA-binding NarL/FixJ family response regulator
VTVSSFAEARKNSDWQFIASSKWSIARCISSPLTAWRQLNIAQQIKKIDVECSDGLTTMTCVNAVGARVVLRYFARPGLGIQRVVELGNTLNGERHMRINRPHIIIADDHAFVADACRKLLEPEFDVVATVGDGRALVHIAAVLSPEVIILDVGMPLLNGLDASLQIKQLLPSVKFVFLTMNTDPALAAEAFRCGASGYVLKTCAASDLILALREVLNDRSYLCPAIVKETIAFLLHRDKESLEKRDRLSERQREVLQLLTEGKTMKEVAYILRLSLHTVAFHKVRIKEILSAKSNTELVQYAIRNHIITSQVSLDASLRGRMKAQPAATAEIGGING